MKERIVIEDKEVSKVCEDCGEYGEGCIMKENCKNKNTLSQTECCFNFRFTPKFKIEECPTNWEELKELCKDLKKVNVCENGYCIEFNHLRFYMDGTIIYGLGRIVKICVTASRMWNIIKNLIGEE